MIKSSLFPTIRLHKLYTQYLIVYKYVITIILGININFFPYLISIEYLFESQNMKSFITRKIHPTDYLLNWTNQELDLFLNTFPLLHIALINLSYRK